MNVLSELKIALWGHSLEQHHTCLKVALRGHLLDQRRTGLRIALYGDAYWTNIILG